MILDSPFKEAVKLSICIPTYNRARHLENCLNSIVTASFSCNCAIQVCVSDNHSIDYTENVVNQAKSLIDIKYHKNESNLGIPKNFLQVVSMAKGEFVWLIGDDDLLLPDSLTRLHSLLDKFSDVDFFYVNSYHLNAEYLEQYAHPFDVNNLPDDMRPFSPRKTPGKIPFLELIDPNISFDFLGGMFLSVFRKKNWDKFVGVLDQEAINDTRVFSHFDNTFPHVKIWAHAFSSSIAYFNSTPLNVCLTGVREWSPMYPLISSVRLVEALDVYRHNGLPFLRYVWCKNFALRNFTADIANIILYKNKYEFRENLLRHYLKCIFYPNTYFSFFYFIGRRICKIYEQRH